MTQRKKIAFLDIDGTLISQSHRMSKKVCEAMKAAKENGHFLCICSGRAYSEIPEEIKSFKSFDGIISAAGSSIIWKDRIILENYLHYHEMETVTGLLAEAEAVYVMEGFENLYMQREVRDRFFADSEGYSKEFGGMMNFFRSTISFDSLSEIEKVHKCSYFYASKDRAWFQKRLDGIGMKVTAFSQSETRGNSGEITKIGYHKGSAVRTLCNYLNIPAEDAIAIGDSENDLEMLQAAGVGIAMGNSSDYVKNAADDVTGSVKEDGVYYAFTKYGLIGY